MGAAVSANRTALPNRGGDALNAGYTAGISIWIAGAGAGRPAVSPQQMVDQPAVVVRMDVPPTKRTALPDLIQFLPGGLLRPARNGPAFPPAAGPGPTATLAGPGPPSRTPFVPLPSTASARMSTPRRCHASRPFGLHFFVTQPIAFWLHFKRPNSEHSPPPTGGVIILAIQELGMEILDDIPVRRV